MRKLVSVRSALEANDRKWHKVTHLVVKASKKRCEIAGFAAG
jgi:hypothetical protein